MAQSESTAGQGATAFSTRLGMPLGVLVSVMARHPRLLPTMARQALALAPRGWWRSWPPIPAPAPDYLRFRSVTAYGGDGDAPPDPDDVAAWLSWVRQWPALTSTPELGADRNPY